MFNIEIDDLIGNAFAVYLEKTGKHVLSLNKIERYGTKVVQSLQEKGIESRLILSRMSTREFFYNNSEWFRLVDDNLVILSDDVTVPQLIKRYSGYLSIKVIIAFRNEDNIKILFSK